MVDDTASHEIGIYANLNSDTSFRLIELSPELLEIIENDEEPIFIKASSEESDIVLCSKTKSFQIKQRNHSNTVMLMDSKNSCEEEKGGPFWGYSSQASVFECKPTSGKIDVRGIPIYDGQGNFKKGGLETSLEYLRENAPISDFEFDKAWFNLNGSSINGQAVILSHDFITRSLHVLIMSIMASNLDFNELSLIEVYKTLSEDDDYTIDVVETVLRKFSKEDKEPFSLNKEKIAQWYGIETLRKFGSEKYISPSEFFIKWKSEFPPFFECSIDLPLLNGFFVRPLPDRLQYLSKYELPKDINERLRILFKLQSTWELNDIIPFIEEFNSKGLKFENFIMKFAKKKKVGKKIYVTPR